MMGATVGAMDGRFDGGIDGGNVNSIEDCSAAFRI